jgi:hypothetical protein
MVVQMREPSAHSAFGFAVLMECTKQLLVALKMDFLSFFEIRFFQKILTPLAVVT